MNSSTWNASGAAAFSVCVAMAATPATAAPSADWAAIPVQTVTLFYHGQVDAGWKKGDVLPGCLLSRADASGSAADNADVRGTWADGQWTVLWTRKLDTGHATDDKTLKPGSVVNVGFAVHDDNVTTRFHHVSFPLTLGVGANGRISSVALK